jgi:hypothetical protein
MDAALENAHFCGGVKRGRGKGFKLLIFNGTAEANLFIDFSII